MLCYFTSNLLGVLVDTDGAKPGLQSCSPTGIHHGGIGSGPGRLGRTSSTGVLVRLLYDKLLLHQVHGKAEAKFKLTLLFHNNVSRQMRRLPVKNAIGRNQDQKSEVDPENLSVFTNR